MDESVNTSSFIFLQCGHQVVKPIKNTGLFSVFEADSASAKVMSRKAISFWAVKMQPLKTQAKASEQKGIMLFTFKVEVSQFLIR